MTREQKLKDALLALLKNFPDKDWLDEEVECGGLKARRWVMSKYLTEIRQAYQALEEK